MRAVSQISYNSMSSRYAVKFGCIKLLLTQKQKQLLVFGAAPISALYGIWRMTQQGVGMLHVSLGGGVKSEV